jgi:hypothetical protein
MTSRLLLVATAIVACAAALLTASVTAASDRRVPTSASNKRAARLDAELLLSRLHLPADAVSSPTEPSGDGGHLRPMPALDGSSASVDARAWWEVPESTSAAFAYITSHPPGGFTSHGSGGLYGGGKPIDQTLNFGWPPVRGVLGQRILAVTVMALSRGETGVLAQAQSDWIVPRPRGEQVPPAVHEVDVASGPVNGSPTVDVSVTSAAQVRRLVSILNGLPIVQPGVYSCPALLLQGARVVTLGFRSGAGGQLLAQATYVAYPHLAYDSGPCNAIDLTIAGRRQKPLLGGSFLRSVQRLLGVHLLG